MSSLAGITAPVLNDLFQHLFDQGRQAGLDQGGQVFIEGVQVQGLDPYDGGIRYMVQGLAQGQCFDEVHLVKGVFGQDPVGDFMVCQTVELPGPAVIDDGIHHNEAAGSW